MSEVRIELDGDSGGGRMLSFGLASGEWADVSADATAEHGVALVRPKVTPAQMRSFTESAPADTGQPADCGR